MPLFVVLPLPLDPSLSLASFGQFVRYDKKLPKNLAVKEKLRTFAPANEDKGV